MPDYTKTIIYVIRCLTLGVIECYVGSTVNFTSRKSGHHHCCIDVNCKGHNYKLYRFIRENGGWENWEMVMLEQYPECKSKIQKLIREREVADRMNAKLNTYRAYRSNEERIEQMNQFNSIHSLINNPIYNPIYNAMKITCACGKTHPYKNKQQHIRTKYHQKFILDNPTVII